MQRPVAGRGEGLLLGAWAVVVGGFGWVAKDSTTPVTFSIDDIRWE